MVLLNLHLEDLKARWRRLLKQSEMVVENVPNVVTACCILHNMCEIHGETFDETWIQAEIHHSSYTASYQSPR